LFSVRAHHHDLVGLLPSQRMACKQRACQYSSPNMHLQQPKRAKIAARHANAAAQTCKCSSPHMQIQQPTHAQQLTHANTAAQTCEIRSEDKQIQQPRHAAQTCKYSSQTCKHSSLDVVCCKMSTPTT
jgi:hypothetical protein